MTITTIRPTTQTGFVGQLIGTSVIAALTDNGDGSYVFFNNTSHNVAVSYAGAALSIPTTSLLGAVRLKERHYSDAVQYMPTELYFGGLHASPDQTWAWNVGSFTTQTDVGPWYSVDRSADTDRGAAFVQSVNQRSYFAGGTDIYIMEMYLDVLIVSQPTVSGVLTSPSGTITTTKRPTVSWTFTPDPDLSQIGNAAPFYSEVKIFSSAQYGAGGFNAASSPSAYYAPFLTGGNSHTVAPGVLQNGLTYKAYVRAANLVNGAILWSNWTAGTAFTLAIPVPTPTSIVPVAASTVTTSRPALNAQVAAMVENTPLSRQWQIATNSTFTTGVHTVTETTKSSTKTAPFAFPTTDRLPQGVWWIRARAIDVDGIAGSYSGGQSFTISHPGTSSGYIPSGGVTAGYATSFMVDWKFSDLDTTDSQTKYQVLMWKSSTPGTVLDSGLQTSTNTFHTFTTGIDATWKNTEIRWKVATYDLDNVSAGYSPEQTFFLRDIPVVTVTAPAAAAVVTTGAPLVTWTETIAGGATQAQFKVDILRSTVLQISSGWIVGTQLSWQVPTPVVTVGPSHQVVVSVMDTNGLVGTATNTFTANYAAPPTPVWSIDSSQFSSAGVNVIDWTGSLTDANFNSWKVLRRVSGTTDWTELFETNTVGTREYKDYLAPSQQSVDYVVVQTAFSFGVLVESVYDPDTFFGISTEYILVCPEDDSLNVPLPMVKSESFSEEFEQTAVNLIGRGRRIERGDRYGITGSLTASLRDVDGGLSGREQRLRIEALRESERVFYLRNPFGDVLQIAITNASFERVAGVGTLEYLELTMDYSEISA
jgi:hypothetical protein